MKLIVSLLLLIGFSPIANAQNESLLPIDERGKFIYYEVVDLTNTPKDSLKIRLVHLFKKRNSSLKFKEIKGDTAFFASGKFIISKTVLVMSRPSGEILYQFSTEIKDGKYRFWLSDFTFIPYQRDRYGNFVPSTTIPVSLENDPGKLNSGQWREYQEQAASHAKEFAMKFKAHMESRTTVSAPVAKKVIDKKW